MQRGAEAPRGGWVVVMAGADGTAADDDAAGSGPPQPVTTEPQHIHLMVEVKPGFWR